ncbi:unnamed protein product [marine sediment metagenome]|uniref:Uncharacterized protein n=1 Tax=marine sediment metagenome TaxID=412755 RepID=X0UBJ0_9ZZZZ
MKELLRPKEMMKQELRLKLGMNIEPFKNFISRITWYTTVYDDVDGTIGMLEFVATWHYYCTVYAYRAKLKGVKFYIKELKNERLSKKS